MAGWPTVADCEAWLDYQSSLTGDDLTAMTEACYAAREWVRSRCWLVGQAGEVPDDVRQAVKMKSAQLFRRRESPEGGSDFTAVAPEIGGTTFDPIDRQIHDLIRPYRSRPIGSAGICVSYPS